MNTTTNAGYKVIQWVNTKKPEHAFHIEDEPGMHHVIAVSGGADSAALALLLHARFPRIKFTMVFTDTGAESDETWEFMGQIESATNNKIDIVTGGETLYTLIEKYNGYLPSSQARWCTRQLKLVSFREWMKKFSGEPMTLYVGLRADEPGRLAFDIENVETVFPFKELGWRREDVFQLLAETIGVPKTYLTRTRSGCQVCPFVRRFETVGLYQRHPKAFERGQSYEKLLPQDHDRHQPGPDLWRDSGIALNWLGFPKPDDKTEITENRTHAQGGLFMTRGLFVACEFFYSGMPGMERFVWHQRLVSYSTTLAGLKKQIDGRYEHLLNTSEVHDMSPDEIRTDAKFAIYYIELPGDIFDPDGPSGGYTWQQGQSYAQVRHITDWATRTLQASQLESTTKRFVANELSVEFEWKNEAENGMANLKKTQIPYGQVVSSMWYQPKEPMSITLAEGDIDDLEEIDLKPCPMCTI